MKKVIKSFLQKIFFIYLFWVFFVMQKRLYYLFRALHNGVMRNRRSTVNIFNFRRSIHRIEKGLIFPKTKEVFAESYILDTVKILEKYIADKTLDKETLSWAVAVLNKYFNTSDHSGDIKKAYDLFCSFNLDNTSSNKIPYRSMDRPPLCVNYEDLYLLSLRRRSVRFFLDKVVEPDIIKKAMRVAALSPSSCNRQAFKFLFFNEKEFVKKISEVPGGIKGYELPSIIVIVGKYSGYFDERDVFAPIIDSSQAAMSLQFAFETLGLSSVCINWPNIREIDKKIRELISLDKDEFVVMMLGVGHPDPEGKVPFSDKRPTEDLLAINKNKLKIAS